MRKNPLDFQIATANHVLAAFRNGQRRVLVADEAGLGKTTVAAEVIRQARELKGIFDDDLYCIVYVCCNLQIAKQNIDGLSDEGETVDLAQSRLSMQHYVYYRKKNNLLENNKDTLILSLTPATSFQMTSGTGSVEERALIFACLKLLPEFRNEKKRDLLSKILQRDAYKSWDGMVNKYIEGVDKADMADYRQAIVASMRRHLDTPYSTERTINEELHRLTSNDIADSQWKEEAGLIIALRKMFAKISLEILNPDLVIMDEFQKFSSLISTNEDESEETMIAREFLANQNIYVLLLSATPYKPYTTIEELNETNNDEQYKDFHRLLNFLYENSETAPDIKIIWHNYSTALSHLENTDFSNLLSKHDAAEEMLYNVMGRTERNNTGIIKEVIPDINKYMTEGDILSYIQMQRLMDKCRRFGQRVFSAPTDYTKSTAFQLSFMDNYKLKEKIQKGWLAGAKRKSKVECLEYLLLNEEHIEKYRMSQYNNARLSYVIESIFGDKQHPTHVEQLLWIPTSHPYYTTKENIFTKNKEFSKYLIFSSWGMVPKMLASLISYESERRLYRKAYKGALYNDDKKSKSESILNTVSVFLAKLYEPEKDFGKSLTNIRENIKKEIQRRLDIKESTNRISSNNIIELMKALDNNGEIPKKLSPKVVEILADIAIASPASCMYRTLSKINKNKNINDSQIVKEAEDVAKDIVNIFYNRYGIAAVNLTCKSNRKYFLKVLDYCVLGNLQATIDEFVHMIGETESIDYITKRFKESLFSHFNQPVDTLQFFTKNNKYLMRKHFAVDFGNTKQTEQAVLHATNVRSAFNSPFRPFVLASTSIGQEGLDFHWYCRKMIHWNLPSNPQNMEQREGRINRYKCLSVRRNIAKLFGEDHFSWNDMFDEAERELRHSNSAMVPYWFLPLDNTSMKERKGDLEYIERIIPIYPMSEEYDRYRRLVGVLSLYRLTMGQPRQEELIQLLEGKVNEEQMKQLLFNLSPYNRSKKQ